MIDTFDRHTGRAFAIMVAVGALAACDGTPTSGSTMLRLVSAPESDTILAAVTQPLVVEVPGFAGTPVVFRANMLPWPGGGAPVPSLHFARSLANVTLRPSDTINTDASGRATIYVRFGSIAGEAVVTAYAPALGDSVQARLTVRPGTPRVSVAPRDTAIYARGRYTLRIRIADAYGNAVPAQNVTFTTDSTAVTVGATGDVAGQAIGRARLIVRMGSSADTVWVSVVPEGRIAAAQSGNGASLVLVDLDGSHYRRFPLQVLDVPMPAWHPSGAYLVAPIFPQPGAVNPTQRLAALDTTTGSWRPINTSSVGGGDGYPEFSRDGTWIYFGSAPGNSYYPQFGSAVFRIRPDGTGQPEPVGYDRDGSTLFYHPSPSPDGSRVAMTVNVSSGSYTLIVPSSPPLGPPPQEFALVGSLPTGANPRWSPVGDDVLMFGSEGMWLMRAGSSSVADRRYLARAWAVGGRGTGGFQGASWSPDGKWIVARASGQLILIEVATDRVLPLAFGSDLSDPAWRP